MRAVAPARFDGFRYSVWRVPKMEPKATEAIGIAFRSNNPMKEDECLVDL